MSSRSEEDEGVYLATRLADLTGLVAFLDRACRRVAASAEVASDLRLATEEVFVNILQHGYAGRPGPVHVRIDARPERITVTLTDEAPAFDPSNTQEADLGSDGEHRALGGLGWHLVRQVMDEVGHEYTAGVGNVFTLVRELSAGPPGSGTR